MDENFSQRLVNVLNGLCITALLSACSVATDVDQYRFVDSVCPRLAECTGGDTYWFVAYELDIPREGPRGVIAGFDLDRTAESACGHPDLESPSGDLGIDNRLAPLFAVLELGDPPISFREVTTDGIINGSALAIFEIGNVDDFMNDDCITARHRRGFVPSEHEANPTLYLDSDADRELDGDVVLDYGVAESSDSRACIIDGTMHIQNDGIGSLPIVGESTELPSILGRAQGVLSESHFSGWVGGAVEVERVIALVPPDTPGLELARDVLRSEADIQSRGAECDYISVALTVEAKAFIPGILR